MLCSFQEVNPANNVFKVADKIWKPQRFYWSIKYTLPSVTLLIWLLAFLDLVFLSTAVCHQRLTQEDTYSKTNATAGVHIITAIQKPSNSILKSYNPLQSKVALQPPVLHHEEKALRGRLFMPQSAICILTALSFQNTKIVESFLEKLSGIYSFYLYAS